MSVLFASKIRPNILKHHNHNLTKYIYKYTTATQTTPINTSILPLQPTNLECQNEIDTPSLSILKQRQYLKNQYEQYLLSNSNDNNSNDNTTNNNNPTQPPTSSNNTSDDDISLNKKTETKEDEQEAYDLTPTQMINELNRFVIGQQKAKRAVAIAWRARWRRRKLDDNYKIEVTPKNILMIGPTGCGKTEVARRLARLSDAPFVKVEATKFTEVGYVGKDVNTIIEDLVVHSSTIVKKKKKKELAKELKESVDDLILKSLMGKIAESELKYWKKKLEDGSLDEMNVEIDVVKDSPDLSSIFGGRGGGLFGGRGNNSPYLVLTGGQGQNDNNKFEKKTYTIKKARDILIEQELRKHLTENELINLSMELAENDGIVFIDEIDKICGKRDFGGDRRVSQEGVQRDLLPLIEGCSINVPNYGKVNTDHILFICAGAFHDSKPSDLMPEFQGRLPVRVELEPLTKEDMYRILTETEYNLINQQIEMLKTENVKLSFTDEAKKKIADIAVNCNDNVENIGARRLVTVIERIMEDINIEAAEKTKNNEYTIDDKYVEQYIDDIVKGEDYDKFIL